MKTPAFNTIFNLILIISILIIILTLTNCKSSSGTPNYPVTEEDAASIISNAVLPQYGGLLAHINDGVKFDQKQGCGIAKDSSVTWANQSTSSPLTYQSNLKWHYQINCTDSAFTGSYAGSISYNGAHFSADNTCTGVLSCMPQPNQTYKIGLTVNIAGTDAKKEVDANKLTTNIDLKANDMVISKLTGLVVSGQMQVSIHISYYNYTGTFRFLGNRQATLVLNSGTAYNVSL